MEDILKEEIESALLDFEIVRIVRSFKITSYDSLSEHFTLTYVKKGENENQREKKNLYYISLPPLPRITQRSLKVFDESGRELPVVPSHEIHDVLVELSNEYLNRILKNIEIGKKEVGKLRCYITEIFEYGIVEDKIEEAEKILENISDCMNSLDGEKKKDCQKILTRLARLISDQRYYYPFVELKNRLDQEEHQIVKYTIERPVGLERKLSFFFGYMSHVFGLILPSTKSFHLEIIPPEGVEISDFEFEDLENSTIVKNKRKKENYSTKKLLYISFSPPEINEIQKEIGKKKDETGGEKTPSVVLKMKINPLMRSLYFLFQVAVLSPLLVRALNLSSPPFGPQNVFTSLALAATLFLSASVYTIDRPMVRKFALYQLVTALFLLLVELVVLVWFSEIALFFFAAAFFSLLAILVIVEFVLGINRQKSEI